MHAVKPIRSQRVAFHYHVSVWVPDSAGRFSLCSEGRTLEENRSAVLEQSSDKHHAKLIMPAAFLWPTVNCLFLKSNSVAQA